MGLGVGAGFEAVLGLEWALKRGLLRPVGGLFSPFGSGGGVLGRLLRWFGGRGGVLIGLGAGFGGWGLVGFGGRGAGFEHAADVVVHVFGGDMEESSGESRMVLELLLGKD